MGALLDLVSGSPWTYSAILVLVALDVLLPLLPSEAVLMSAGVLAGTGDLSIGVLIAAGAVGALAGDAAGYSLGRVLGPRVATRISRSAKSARRFAWVERKLETRAGVLIFAARFVPGGRSATALAAGAVGLHWRRFVLLSIGAGVLWVSAAALVGYAGARGWSA